MTTATETERTPEANVQPSASAGEPPERPAALFRIGKHYPELKNKVQDWTCPVVDRMCETLDGKGVDCLADTVEFVERWKPDGAQPSTAETEISPEQQESIDRITSRLPGFSEEAIDRMADVVERHAAGGDKPYKSGVLD